MTGAMGLVASILIGGFSTIAKATGAQPLIACSGCLGSMVGLFGFCWFIAGNVWVFGNWSSVTFEGPPNGVLEHPPPPQYASYCDETAYMFSFVLLIMAWVAFPVGCVFAWTLCWATIHACLK